MTSGQVASNTFRPRASASSRTALRHAVGGKHQRIAGRHVVQVLDEDRALVAQVVHHVGVVDDFVAHVDRRAELAASARSTISMARSTPAQKPRGWASRISLSIVRSILFVTLLHSTEISLTSNVHRLAGQRMVEVEQAAVVAQFAQHAGEAAAVRRGELDQVADLVLGARRRVFVAAWRATRGCISSGLRSPKASPGASSKVWCVPSGRPSRQLLPEMAPAGPGPASAWRGCR